MTLTRTQIREIASQYVNKLPKPTKAQEVFLKNIIKEDFFTHKDNVVCPICGTEFSRKGKRCGGCKREFHNNTQPNNRKFSRKYAYAIFSIVKGVQVQRTFEVCVYFRRFQPLQMYFNEVCQCWYTTPNNVVYASKNLFMYTWSCGGELSVRRTTKPSSTQYDYQEGAWVYPKGKILPLFEKYGLQSFGQLNKIGKGNTGFMFNLTTNNNLETLFKLEQYPLLRGLSTYEINRYWEQIKLVLRHKYSLTTKEDVADWKDTMDLLRRLNMDTHNPIYVCPENLKELHDTLLERVRRIQERERARQEREQRKEKALRDKAAQEKYAKRMSRYFGLVISDNNITIAPLQSVKEFYKEGEILHHCVGQMRYFEKADTLILSARIDNKPIETIEINLKSFEIMQCRGKYNRNSEYHQIILDMVKNNLNKIKSLKRKKLVA